MNQVERTHPGDGAGHGYTALQGAPVIHGNHMVIRRDLVVQLLGQLVVAAIETVDQFPRLVVTLLHDVHQAEVVHGQDHARILLEGRF